MEEGTGFKRTSFFTFISTPVSPFCAHLLLYWCKTATFDRNAFSGRNTLKSISKWMFDFCLRFWEECSPIWFRRDLIKFSQSRLTASELRVSDATDWSSKSQTCTHIHALVMILICHLSTYADINNGSDTKAVRCTCVCRVDRQNIFGWKVERAKPVKSLARCLSASVLWHSNM